MPFFAPCLGIISSIIKKKNIKVIGIVDNAIAHEKRLGDNMLVNFFKKMSSSYYFKQKSKK